MCSDNKFPPCFPKDFEKNILPKQAKCENKEVYRVIKNGKINRESFIGTFEEMKLGLIPKRKLNLKNPEAYSTSCFIEYNDAEYWLKVFLRKKPKAIIAEGITEASCGPSVLTSDYKEKEDSHVDWWIYEKSEPQKYFKKVE